jgi:hypothetical protein
MLTLYTCPLGIPVFARSTWIGRGSTEYWPPQSCDLTARNFCQWDYLKCVMLNLEIYYTSHFKWKFSHTGVEGDCNGIEINADQHDIPQQNLHNLSLTIFIHVSSSKFYKTARCYSHIVTYRPTGLYSKCSTKITRLVSLLQNNSFICL